MEKENFLNISAFFLFQVLSVGNLYSPDIWYQYVVSRGEGKSPSYHWKLQEQWSACSKLCHGITSETILNFEKKKS